MLETLTIKNLALIEDMHIEFHKGFTVLSGETGAGKSIILGALNLLLGQRADSSFVRSGCEEASVTAALSLGDEHPFCQWLQQRGIHREDGALLIHRLIKVQGRGGVYVQGIPVTLADLKSIGEALFDIHGQHEHQSLLHSEHQRKVLDSYATLEQEITAFSHLFRQMEEQRKELATLLSEAASAKKEIDYLQFVVDELNQASLVEQEDEALALDIAVLSQFETIQSSLETSYGELKGMGNEGVLAALNTALQSFRKAAKAAVQLQPMVERLESAAIEIEDIANSMRDELSGMSFSQYKLDEMQSRLALLQRLKKKYGPLLEHVIQFRDESIAQLSKAQNSDELIEEAEKRVQIIEKQTQQAAKQLTIKRKQAALELTKPIIQRLALLGMPHVAFEIEVVQRPLGLSGADQINFLFSANVGEPLHHLKEIASGGELSRVMLAVKSVLALNDAIETLVFDEVDAGIGGAVAVAVGQTMQSLAASRQVVAITHLASIASKADSHLVVRKEVVGGRTYTRIEEVRDYKRAQELARMLSGRQSDEKAVAHAQSMLGLTQKS